MTQSLNDLKVGQRVKVKGKPGEGRTFMALEIGLKEGDDQTEMEGLIQSLDHQRKTLRLLNQEVMVSGSAEIKDLGRNSIGLQNLKVGDLVKLKGNYSASGGFVPNKIKMKQAMGFTIEELQGHIGKIDPAKKTLEVAGVTVVVNEKTSIELD
jgi:hypothetical protein